MPEEFADVGTTLERNTLRKTVNVAILFCGEESVFVTRTNLSLAEIVFVTDNCDNFFSAMIKR